MDVNLSEDADQQRITLILGSEGEWRDIITGERFEFNSIPWRISSEPTGFYVENCTGLTNDVEYSAFDVDCEQKQSTVCQDIEVGMCLDILVSFIFIIILRSTTSFEDFVQDQFWTDSIDW